MIRYFALLCCSVLLLPMAALAFHGDVDPIPATLVADREYEVTSVSSEGHIEGSTPSGQKKILFKDIEKIEYANNVYTVTMKDGTKVDMKFGQLKTHYTSPTFDCMIKNPDTGKIEEAMLDPTTIKSLVFKTKPSAEPTAAPATQMTSPAPAAASDEKQTVPPASSEAKTAPIAVDRKDPAAVAQALLTAIRANDSATVVSLLNAVNQKKISPKDIPEMMKELAAKIGSTEKIGAVKSGPSFMAKGTVCAFVRTEGVETYVITLTKEGDEYLFEDINSPDTAQWEKLPLLK